MTAGVGCKGLLQTAEPLTGPGDSSAQELIRNVWNEKRQPGREKIENAFEALQMHFLLEPA